MTFSSSRHSHHQSPLVLLQVQVLQQRDLHQRSLFRELIWSHCLPAAATSQSQPGKPARRPLARGARVDPCPPPVAAGGAPSYRWCSRSAVGHLGGGGSPWGRRIPDSQRAGPKQNDSSDAPKYLVTWCQSLKIGWPTSCYFGPAKGKTLHLGPMVRPCWA